MFIVTSFSLVYNTITGVNAVFSDEIICCPLCNGCLRYRNSRLRRLKNLAGEVSRLLLRRFYCERCKKLHTEIPTIIQPYKHYDSDTIQSVIDESEKADSCPADDSTIRRWKSTFAKSETDLSQRLASVYARLSGEKPALSSKFQPLAHIRTIHEYWLAFVMTLLINHGHKLCTRFAFCQIQFAGSFNELCRLDKERSRKNDKTINDTS